MNKTIHELNSLAQAQADDEFIIYDVSEGESKKIQVQNLTNPNYSTTEQKTGGTWIDGKPIYRKVYNVNISAIVNGWVNTNISVAEMDTITKANYLDTGAPVDGLVQLTTKYNNNLRLFTTNAWSIDTVILEYTKTTDQKFAQKENRVYT